MEKQRTSSYFFYFLFLSFYSQYVISPSKRWLSRFQKVLSASPQRLNDVDLSAVETKVPLLSLSLSLSPSTSLSLSYLFFSFFYFRESNDSKEDLKEGFPSLFFSLFSSFSFSFSFSFTFTLFPFLFHFLLTTPSFSSQIKGQTSLCTVIFFLFFFWFFRFEFYFFNK